MKLRIIAYTLNVIIGLTIGFLLHQCKKGNVDHQNESYLVNRYQKACYSPERCKSQDKIYDYRFTIDDALYELNISNYQRVNWRNEAPLNLSPSQIRRLNGTYVWKSKIYFKTQREMFDYICENFSEMQKYKVSSVPHEKVKVKTQKSKNIYDEYNDRLDEYLDDPEDEIEFDPDIFDFQDD